jgi:hypothetical protein
VREPQAAADLQQQRRDTDPLETLFEGTDRRRVARPQRRRLYREAQHQVAAHPDRGAEQVQNHEKFVHGCPRAWLARPWHQRDAGSGARPPPGGPG